MKNAFAKGGFIDAADGSGHRIYYESYGPEDAPATMMVHGNAGYIFDPQKLSLWDLQKQRIIIIHARGVGNSQPAGKTEHNLYPHLAEDIETLRAHLNLEKIGLFGWSAGAAVSLLYAQKYTSHCREVALYGAFLGTQRELQDYYARSRKKYPAGWAKFCAHYRVDTAYDAVRRYNRAILNGNMIEKRRAVTRYENIFGPFKATPQDLATLVRNRTIYANMIEENFGVSDGQIEAEMHHLTGIPVLLIRGRSDYIGSPRAGELVIENAGHDIHDPQVQTQLRMILAQIRAPASPSRPPQPPQP